MERVWLLKVEQGKRCHKRTFENESWVHKERQLEIYAPVVFWGMFFGPCFAMIESFFLNQASFHEKNALHTFLLFTERSLHVKHCLHLTNQSFTSIGNGPLGDLATDVNSRHSFHLLPLTKSFWPKNVFVQPSGKIWNSLFPTTATAHHTFKDFSLVAVFMP